jgi:hypothetical protein
VIHPMTPEDREQTVQLGLDNPMPKELRQQIEDWIEPQTINMGIKHGDVMDCVRIAFPLIRDYLAEHGSTESS